MDSFDVAFGAGASRVYSLTCITRHVIGCNLMKTTRVEHALDDALGNDCLALRVRVQVLGFRVWGSGLGFRPCGGEAGKGAGEERHAQVVRNLLVELEEL